MQAAVWHGAGDLRVEQRPLPTIGPGEALLKVAACGVCGTDHRIVSGGHRHYPAGTIRVPGHEIVGEIVAAGATAGELPRGLVFVAPNMGCGRCRQCLSGNNNRCAYSQAIGITMDGAFAEYVRIPAAAVAQGNVIALRDGTDPLMATLIEPLACVLRGQGPLDIRPADSVLIIGAGSIGILHLMLARLKGAGQVLIADQNTDRLAAAKSAGADVTIDVTANDVSAVARSETGGSGADVVIVAAPSPEAMAAAISQAALGGRVSYFAGLATDQGGVVIDTKLIHYRELTVSGTSACSTLDCHRAADIVNSGRLDLARLITRRLALDELPSEFSAGSDRNTIKTVMVR